jgi:LysR family nitrogen assimilation transcriptional regulator
MDIRQLKYFVAVARQESLTAASEALNVTQPAIGQQIRKLEQDVGLKLLNRHSRGMRLTPVGKVLLRHAEDVLNSMERIERELSRYRNSGEGTVRIGVTPSLSRVLVPRLMEVGFDRYPAITLLFNQGFPLDLERLWEAGECDLAFVQSDIETAETESLPLYNEKMCLIGAPALCADLPDLVSIQQIAELPIVMDTRSLWLREAMEREFRVLRTGWTDLIESSSIDIRREYLVQGRRFCLAPIAQFAAEAEAGLAEFRHIDYPDFDRTIHLAGPAVELMTETERNIRALIVEIVDAAIAEGSFGWQPAVWSQSAKSKASIR